MFRWKTHHFSPFLSSTVAVHLEPDPDSDRIRFWHVPPVSARAGTEINLQVFLHDNPVFLGELLRASNRFGD